MEHGKCFITLRPGLAPPTTYFIGIVDPLISFSEEANKRSCKLTCLFKG